MTIHLAIDRVEGERKPIAVLLADDERAKGSGEGKGVGNRLRGEEGSGSTFGARAFSPSPGPFPRQPNVILGSLDGFINL